MTISFERVALPVVPWADLDQRATRTVFQTRAWLDFLVETQGAEPVAARIVDGTTPVGWFTGATIRRAGLTFLGSPLRGWTTPAMGFDLEPGADPTAVLEGLARFAFRDLRAIHLEVADRELLDEQVVPQGYVIGRLPGYQLDLAPDDDLLATMKRNGRRDVRRALRNGIVVDPVDPADPGTFAADYYAHVSEAFAKRDLTPTYPQARVEALIRHLGPTGRLLLLEARTADGELAATGIFPGMAGGTAEYWMGGSERRLQHLLPNEALMWSALRTWRDRGAVRFNFGGGGSYKAKYGGEPHVLPWLRRSRFGVLEHARSTAYRLYRRRLQIR
ncbi:GNAT family N-acetyltransferase [Aquihabitans sp. McL0605]|uniref:GNAT family N-acetyltransferase n=1 Tax=Aquihabitans sp. McL0605 TaxID=3415671 RepID=UPI003CF83C88